MLHPLPGRATPEATAHYHRRLDTKLQPPGGVRLGGTGLQVSGIGFGCYRVHDSVERHRLALRKALSAGVNLIDASANYGDGGAERLVGQVLEAMTREQLLNRDEVVVVTKGGYIQGFNMELATRREAEGRPYAEVVKVSPDCWHCLHPEFIAEQIELSRERLGLECLDVYLLHNPEYFLQQARQMKMSPQAAGEEYYRRIRAAFEVLEEKVATGVIGHYGVSSNTFPDATTEYAFTSLERCLELAEAVGRERGGAHHFQVIQLPANLLETGAWTEANQLGGTRNVLQFAAEHGLGVLINRPLNAFHQNSLVRLADPPADLREQQREIETMIDALRDIEHEADELLEEHEDEPAKLSVARYLYENWRSIQNEERWQELLDRELIPLARESYTHVVEAMNRAAVIGDEGELDDRYLQAINRAIQSLAEYFEALSQPRQEELHALIATALPPALATAPLSQKAIWFLRHQAGVSSVLVGMRREQYVDDALAAASVPI